MTKCSNGCRSVGLVVLLAVLQWTSRNAEGDNVAAAEAPAFVGHEIAPGALVGRYHWLQVPGPMTGLVRLELRPDHQFEWWQAESCDDHYNCTSQITSGSYRVTELDTGATMLWLYDEHARPLAGYPFVLTDRELTLGALQDTSPSALDASGRVLRRADAAAQAGEICAVASCDAATYCGSDLRCHAH